MAGRQSSYEYRANRKFVPVCKFADADSMEDHYDKLRQENTLPIAKTNSLFYRYPFGSALPLGVSR